MRFASVCTFIFLGVFLSGVESNPVHIRSEDLRIILTENHQHYGIGLGTVRGYRPCGGSGRLVDWRVTGCTPDKTCQLVQGSRIQSDFNFIPSESISQLGVRLILITDGKMRTLYEKELKGSDVEGGRRYTFHAAGGPKEELKGQTIAFRTELYRVTDNSVEVCGEADFEVV